MNPNQQGVISNILGNLATGLGIGLATRGVLSGSTPGNEQFVNPTTQNRGGAGQPGTTPGTAVLTPVRDSIVPGISNTALFIGAGSLLLVGVAVVLARR